ncbi:MAG: hypothetical protein WA964_07640 [Ilumatobacter sp.]
MQLPDDWQGQRDELRRLATHVVARAQAEVTGNFALMPLPGGFGTPQFGPDRQRVRMAGGSLFVEQAVGNPDGTSTARTDVHMVAGSTLRELCTRISVDVELDFSVGGDTPPLGDADAMITLDSDTTTVLGDWWALGQRAMDIAIASFPDPQASVVRLWPEHFDVGIDLAADPTNQPDGRVNLGAAAGDEFHQEPYLYVGPWGPQRPGPTDFWNAPFGATLSFGDLDVSANPLAEAAEFFLHGISHLR